MALPEGRYCPYCGEGLLREPVDGRDLSEEALKPACRNCGYVHLDAPTPVAGALVERDGEVLLVRPHGAEEFALGGGNPEPYETIEEAAAREVREETGLEVQVERILGSYSCDPMGRNLVLVVCVARVVGGDFRLQEEELAEGGWFALDGLPAWPEGWPLQDVFADHGWEGNR